MSCKQVTDVQWVKTGMASTLSARLVPQKATEGVHWRPSAEFQLLDHLIGTCQHHRWDSQPKRPRRLKINEELDLRRLHHRQISRFFAFQDTTYICAGLAKTVRLIGAVTHEQARLHTVARL